MIFKVSFLIAASVVACAVSHKINTISRKDHSTIVDVQDGACMETHKIEDDRASSDIPEEGKEEANQVSTKMLKNVSEKDELKREFEQRKVNVQGQLLELYGLNEEKSCLAKLQKDLDEKSKEIVVLSDTIASMQGEKKKYLLSDEIKQGVLAAKKLELAKKKIAELERAIDGNTRCLKDRVSMIEEKVCGLRGVNDDDGFGEREDAIEKKIKGFGDAELEVGLRRRINKQLELEKRELTVKLLGAQDRIASLSQMTEEKIVLNITEEISQLKHGNEALSREIETLQKERFEMVEELVYQRWLNICLRLEKQDKNSPQSGTSKSNPISNPPSSYSSSFSFASTDSDQVDTTTLGSSSSTSSQNKSEKRFSLIKRIITKWGCKDDSVVVDPVAEKRMNFNAKTGRFRRFSASLVLDRNSSMMRNKGDDRVTSKSPFVDKKKLEKSGSRVRRVSFNDLVKTHYDMPSSFRRRCVEKSCCNPDVFLEGEEKSEIILVSDEGSIEHTRLENTDEGDCITSEIAKISKENKVEEEDQMMHHIFNVLFVFLFIIFFVCLM